MGHRHISQCSPATQGDQSANQEDGESNWKVNQQAMPKPYRIAHFSDFHLSDTQREFGRAVNILANAIEEGADHLVITGDVVDVAEVPVFKSLWMRLRKLGWTGAERITFAPGNHDIFPCSKRIPLFSPSRPTLNFQRLCNLTRYSRTGRSVEVLGNPYPVGKVLSSQVVLAALDTTRNGQYSPFRWAEGELNQEQREAVTSFFARHKDKPHKVIAMHHTPWDHESESDLFPMNFAEPGPDEVQGWLRECDATLVLCGHYHAITQRDKLSKRCWVLQSGTAGGTDEDDPPDDAVRTYHIIELSQAGKVRFLERSFRGYELDG